LHKPAFEQGNESALIFAVERNTTIGHFLLSPGLNHLAARPLLSRKFAKGHGKFAENERRNMKSRRMKRCVAEFEAVHKRGGLGPEQDQAIQFVVLRLKQLKRLKKASNQDAFDCVADISEKLVKAFCKLNIKL
jgi:hypothetical protein